MIRRRFLTATLGLIAAPAIVKADGLMRISPQRAPSAMPLNLFDLEISYDPIATAWVDAMAKAAAWKPRRSAPHSPRTFPKSSMVRSAPR